MSQPKRTLRLTLALCSLGLATVGVAGQGQSSPSSGETAQAPLTFVLKDGTPVKLRLGRTISSADAHAGDRVDFEALEAVTVNDRVVIPKGSAAWGTVTQARRRSRPFRGGRLDVNIDLVTLANGQTAPLRAVSNYKGEGRGEALAGTMVMTGVVFFPALPLFLFTPGKNIDIPKGTEITAYINGDVPLDPNKFITKPAPEMQKTPLRASSGHGPREIR